MKLAAELLSHHLSADTPVYPGMTKLTLEPLKSIKKGDSSNSWVMTLGNHVGTHVDAPKHFDDNGRSISEFSVEELIFPKAHIVEVPKSAGELITARDLEDFEDVFKECSLVMIRTGIEEIREKDPEAFASKGVCLSAEAARYIASFYPNLRAIGIDAISISSPLHREEGRKAHRELLKGKDFLIIEDMALVGKRGDYEFVIVAPFFVKGIDSAPCTVIGCCARYET